MSEPKWTEDGVQNRLFYVIDMKLDDAALTKSCFDYAKNKNYESITYEVVDIVVKSLKAEAFRIAYHNFGTWLPDHPINHTRALLKLHADDMGWKL